MGELSNLKNISKVSEKHLRDAGIETIEDFRALGSREAFRRIRKNDDTVCLSMLYGLEGALSNARWCDLDDATKKDLKAFYIALRDADPII